MSARNDDVALEVKNAANGNLIHAASRRGKGTLNGFPPNSEGAHRAPQGNPDIVAGQ
jgi:hypothetical protein